MLHILSSSDLWFLTIQGASSLLLVALGVYLPLRAGVLNLSGEGQMLFACFGAVLLEAKLGGGWGWGVLGGVLAGILVSACFASCAITLRANTLVIGIAFNFLAAGATTTATSALYGTAGTISTPDLRALPTWSIPGLESVPWLGKVLSGQTSLTYLALALAVALTWWLTHTRWGLTARVTGSRPDIADAMRRPVTRTQWQALLIGGALVGLGGAQLALAAAAQFSPEMTAGRGYIALAIALIANPRTFLLAPLAVVFALFDALGINLQQLGLPPELSGVLPYVVIALLLLAPQGRRLSGARSNGWRRLRAAGGAAQAHSPTGFFDDLGDGRR